MKTSLLVAAAIATLVVTSSRNAAATPTFPDVMREHIGMPSTPSCAVCHTGGVTGRGTVNTPLGTTLRSRGLVANDEGSLRTALDAIEAEGKDSDGDGSPDVAELVAGGDPNVGADGSGSDAVVPEYGCSSSSRRSPDAGAAAFGLLIGLGLFATRRRR